MSQIKRAIEVQVVKEGVHRYPAAANDPLLKDVAYLANEHFHYFYITVRVEVFHNDRCLEFQQFRRYLDNLFSSDTIHLNNSSCEMIAESLIERVGEDYPGRDMQVRVFEDNINGAILDFKSNK